MTTLKSNELCGKCGDPLEGQLGYVEMRTSTGEYRRLCFSCAIADMESMKGPDEIEMEEEE